MDDEKILELTGRIEETLGKENSALIADDLGVLISSNAETQKSLRHKDEQIEKLRERNEKLILANGNLLKQIPAEGSEPVRQEGEKKKSSINLADAFDAHGRFIH